MLYKIHWLSWTDTRLSKRTASEGDANYINIVKCLPTLEDDTSKKYPTYELLFIESIKGESWQFGSFPASAYWFLITNKTSLWDDTVFSKILNKMVHLIPKPSFWAKNMVIILITRAFSSSLLHVIIACNHLPFLKIFSNIVYFCLNFQIFCPF